MARVRREKEARREGSERKEIKAMERMKGEDGERDSLHLAREEMVGVIHPKSTKAARSK